MAKQKFERIKIWTQEFRLSYPNFDKPRAFKQGDKETFSCTMLFPKKVDLAADVTNKAGKLLSIGMRKAATKLIKATWPAEFKKFGTDWKSWEDPIKLPFRNGDTDRAAFDKQSRKPKEGYPGHIFVRASTLDRPGLLIERNGDRVPAPDGGRDFYPGCWARAVLVCCPYDTAGNRGITFYLNNVLKTRDDTPLAGRANAEDDFADIEQSDVDSGDDPDSSSDSQEEDSDAGF
jgi:hypothetical protein